jgi:hydroxymethylglutaryl-CoA synthase
MPFLPIAIHGKHVTKTYGFYKPRLEPEYPEVDSASHSHDLPRLPRPKHMTYKAEVEKSRKIQSLKSNGHSLNGNGHAMGNSHGNGNGVTQPDSNSSSDVEVVKPRTLPPVSMEDFDYSVFHFPYCELVQKGHVRLVSSPLTTTPYPNNTHPSSPRRTTTSSSTYSPSFSSISNPSLLTTNPSENSTSLLHSPPT